MKIGRKLLAAVTAGVICAVGVPLAGLPDSLLDAGIIANAEEYTYGDLKYDYLVNGTIEITGCDQSVTEMVIPEEIDGVKVTSIGEGAFACCYGLSYISIPNSVTNIGRLAFSSCTYLTSITLPTSLISIGELAFFWCPLKDITIPDHVTNIGRLAFNDCEVLTSITIPSSVSSIGEGAFLQCYSLTDVYYTGTERKWNTIAIGEDNDDLLNATIHFNDGTSSNQTTTATNSTGSTTTTTTTEPATSLETGDLDGDGSVTINDAYNTLLAYSKLSAGLESGLTDAQLAAADVDGDGKVTINDAFKILLYYATKSAGGTPSWD